MRIGLVLIFVFLMVVRVDAQENACSPATGKPLLIGAVFPPETLLNREAAAPYRGMVAMVDAVNACGGVAGRPVEVVYIPASNVADAQSAVAVLQDQVSLIVGSGLTVISEVLADEAGADTFLYWEVSEALDNPHAYALSPHPNNFQLGMLAAAFVEAEIPALLADGEPLRVGLINEDRLRAEHIADGVSDGLDQPPSMREMYATRETNGYRLALRAREETMNVIVLAAFETGADRLWYDMREADANLAAWVQVGGDQFRENVCDRIGNTDSLISVSAIGAVNEHYRTETLGELYELYRANYEEQTGREPGERADLAASGMLILLRGVLPAVEGDYTSENIQQAAQAASDVRGLMGESWSPAADTYFNQAAVAIIQQRQNGEFCTISPEFAVTCALPLQSFPTWRDRVKMSSC